MPHSKRDPTASHRFCVCTCAACTPTIRARTVARIASLTRGRPFTEAKEMIAGYSLLEVKSLAEAIEWAKRAPFGVGVQDGEEPVVEIRPLFDPADFDPGKGV